MLILNVSCGLDDWMMGMMLDDKKKVSKNCQ